MPKLPGLPIGESGIETLETLEFAADADSKICMFMYIKNNCH